MASVSNPLKQVQEFGQSIWYDNVDRKLISQGDFQRMIQEDGLRGVTSNPTIFEKAISQSSDYDADLRRLGQKGMSPEDIYWTLVIKDIQDVADLFRPVYDETKGLDGYVSLEVSPLLALNTQATTDQARALWKRVDRPNLMVKIPATKEGLPAIEACIADGININVTLIFSVERYREVMEAYLKGLEKRVAQKKSIDTIASVASFFVSRVDTEADKRIEQKMNQASPDEKPEWEALLHKTGIANSKVAYEVFERVFASDRFKKLKDAGAAVQRPLWASTSTKNPKLSDVLYAEELIGPQSVNTLPPATLDAFRDHGKPANRIRQNIVQAHAHLKALEAQGISLADVTAKLESDGVKAFSESFQKLIDRIKAKENKIGIKTS